VIITVVVVVVVVLWDDLRKSVDEGDLSRSEQVDWPRAFVNDEAVDAR
jgi:hypothetical protein